MADYAEEIKARCLAALLAGQSPALLSREFGIPIGTLKSWKSRQLRGESVATVATDERAAIGALLLDYLAETLLTAKAQQRMFRNEEWVHKQSAAEIATLHGISVDKAVQLLQALSDPDDDAPHDADHLG